MMVDRGTRNLAIVALVVAIIAVGGLTAMLLNWPQPVTPMATPTEMWTPEPEATEDAGMSFAIGGAIPRQRDLLVERELQVGQRFYSQGTAEFTGAATFTAD